MYFLGLLCIFKTTTSQDFENVNLAAEFTLVNKKLDEIRGRLMELSNTFTNHVSSNSNQNMPNSNLNTIDPSYIKLIQSLNRISSCKNCCTCNKNKPCLLFTANASKEIKSKFKNEIDPQFKPLIEMAPFLGVKRCGKCAACSVINTDLELLHFFSQGMMNPINQFNVNPMNPFNVNPMNPVNVNPMNPFFNMNPFNVNPMNPFFNMNNPFFNSENSECPKSNCNESSMCNKKESKMESRSYGVQIEKVEEEPREYEAKYGKY